MGGKRWHTVLWLSALAYVCRRMLYMQKNCCKSCLSDRNLLFLHIKR